MNTCSIKSFYKDFTSGIHQYDSCFLHSVLELQKIGMEGTKVECSNHILYNVYIYFSDGKWSLFA